MKCRLRTAFTPTKFRVRYSVDGGDRVEFITTGLSDVVALLNEIDYLRDEGRKVDYEFGRIAPKPYTVVV